MSHTFKIVVTVLLPVPCSIWPEVTSLHIPMMCMHMDSATGIWDVQFNTGSKLQSRKVYYAWYHLLICYRIVRREWPSRSQIFLFVHSGNWTQAIRCSDQHTNNYTTVTPNWIYLILEIFNKKRLKCKYIQITFI